MDAWCRKREQGMMRLKREYPMLWSPHLFKGLYRVVWLEVKRNMQNEATIHFHCSVLFTKIPKDFYTLSSTKHLQHTFWTLYIELDINNSDIPFHWVQSKNDIVIELLQCIGPTLNTSIYMPRATFPLVSLFC